MIVVYGVRLVSIILVSSRVFTSTCSQYSYADYMNTDYRSAAEILWGKAGAYVHDSYDQHRPLFPNLPDQLPIVIGITAYGRCIGLTRTNEALDGPRITIASNLFSRGIRHVDDVMVHEMLHASLILAGKPSDHDTEAWYAAVRELSPHVLGYRLDVKRGSDRKSVRLPNPNYVPGGDAPRTIVRKERVASNHEKVSRWPNSFRPDDYDGGPTIPCPTY